jgi:hypothetical protein
MSKQKDKPIFAVNPAKVGAGYEVVVTWPGYKPQKHLSFDTEAEAQSWITKDAPAWIAKHPN